ncbi:Protein of unknown function (DUF1045) [Desulfocapsa sulfexigens DSM 10523]|uniref:Phosphonate metabolism protein n=1 Tax=Desulfocapsa sulfexigens (strain DSM 10523 / SB164P1) TaxID=1167006 RepID=M1NEG8_DESSD|nr:DUF1045 domain-containing protein [Desulfocapsa sulfexigens]AGF78099.1 Protein of unknown function (DUF1045) [Desulfocapsa sulfexigens DSM 10523]
MRFAIYYAPSAQSRLFKIGHRWLSQNGLAGKGIGHNSLTGISAARLAEIIDSPRHYGLHGTLKAPFRLAKHRDEEELHSCLNSFTRQRKPFVTPPLCLRLLNDFFCLCPERRASEIDNLAAECVQVFDEFRAPLNQIELDRRGTGALTEDEKHNLFTWGYPYVMEQFRFHITLTGRIDDEHERELLQTCLGDFFAPVIGKALTVDGISLFVEPSPGEPFFCSRHYPFSL